MKIEDLHSSRVRIHDSLLSLLFPDFTIVKYSYDDIKVALLTSKRLIVNSNRSVISKQIMGLLSQAKVYMINTETNYQYSLFTRKEIAEYINENNFKGKSLPKSFDYMNIEEEDFLLNIKTFYVSGRLLQTTDEEHIYQLYQTYVSNLKEFIQLFYESKVPYPVLESIFLTFLTKAKNIKDLDISNYRYATLLKRVNKMYPKALIVIKEYALRNDRNKSTLLAFLLKLRELMK